MKHVLFACLLVVVAATDKTVAQTQSRGRGAAAALTGVSVQVTDQGGNPLADVQVSMIGTIDRSGTTGADGRVEFRNVGPGTYRVRCEQRAFITFEREVIVRAGQATTSVALNAAPAQPVAPAPPPPAPAPARAVDPRLLSIPDFLEKNFLKSEPQKTSLLGCAEGGTARLLQIRDPLDNQQHADADEMLYVVAGAGTIRIGTRDTPADAGFFALVPRGTTLSLRRQGRNPLILLSILTGQRCEQQ